MLFRSEVLSKLSSRASDNPDYYGAKKPSVSEGGNSSNPSSPFTSLTFHCSVGSDTYAHFPCPLYYLSRSGCEKGDECLYTHDYPLCAAQISELAALEKKKPCVELVQGQSVSFHPSTRACFGPGLTLIFSFICRPSLSKRSKV